MCNEFSNSYCDDKEGNARVSSLLFACVCFKTFCCSSTVMSKCAPKPILKLLKKKKRINLLQKSHFAKGRKFSREKKKKNGKIEEKESPTTLKMLASTLRLAARRATTTSKASLPLSSLSSSSARESNYSTLCVFLFFLFFYIFVV